MTGHTIGRLSIFIWRHVTPMLLILTFSSILTVGILDGFRYEVWTHRSVSTKCSNYCNIAVHFSNAFEFLNKKNYKFVFTISY